MNRSPLYRAVLICGAGPLASGIGVLLLWIVTRSEACEAAGGLCVLLGTPAVLVGLVMLIFWLQKPDLAPGVSRWKPGIAAFLLLMINFPAAAGAVAVYWVTKYPIREIVIADVTKEQTLILETDLKSPDVLGIRVIGDLDGSATFSTDAHVVPILSLKPGPLDVRWNGDWYSPPCVLRYVPQKVTKGHLRVEYRFQ